LSSISGSVAAITFSSAMHSLIALDAQGRPISPCILWSDKRSATIAEQLKKTATGRDIYQQTGTPIHAMSPLCKIAWLRQFDTRTFQNSAHFIGIKEYIVFRLTNELLTDYSIASATGLFDPHQGEWCAPALDFAGIKARQLASPVPPGHRLESLKKEIAQYLKIPVGTPFFIGASDGCLANLGAGASLPGEAVLTIGTSGALRMNSGARIHDEKQRLFNYYLLENQYVAGGASNNGGIVYEWFAQQFFGTKPNSKSMKPRQEALTLLPAGSEGLLFVPYILGERAPVWNAHATGGFHGITQQHSLAHFHKAVLEGILLNMSLIGEVLEEVVAPMQVIFANGGFVKMPVWVQMAADVFGKKICLSESEEASALGAALLGMKALGHLQDFSLVKNRAGLHREFLPNLDHHAVYLQKRQALKAAYERLLEK
jgi:gluconokinase